MRGPKELALLIGSARDHGMIAEPEHRVLAGAIDLGAFALRDVMMPLSRAIGVEADATCDEAEAVSRATGRSRLVVNEGGRPIGIAHVRDIVRASRPAPIASVSSPPTTIESTVSLLDALTTMRRDRAQLVVVTDAARPVGLVAMEDLLERVLGRFDDETDHR